MVVGIHVQRQCEIVDVVCEMRAHLDAASNNHKAIRPFHFGGLMEERTFVCFGWSNCARLGPRRRQVQVVLIGQQSTAYVRDMYEQCDRRFPEPPSRNITAASLA